MSPLQNMSSTGFELKTGQTTYHFERDRPNNLPLRHQWTN
jgi:hypothetical protein